MSTPKTKSAPDPAKLEQLQVLAVASQKARLAPNDEQLAIELTREFLSSGKGGVVAVAPILSAMSWNVAVESVCPVWMEFKPAQRKYLLAELPVTGDESVRRLVMSLARGLQPVDPATALKLLENLCAGLLADGEPSQKSRQNFAGVFLGKGRPWFHNLPLADLADSSPLARCVVYAGMVSPPLSQLYIVRWLVGAGLMDVLPPELLAQFTGQIQRWPGRLKKELSAESLTLPGSIAAVIALPEEARHEKPQPRPVKPAPEPSAHPEMRRENPAPSRRESPSRESSGDIPRLLQQIDREFQRLRQELQQARSAPKIASPPRNRSREAAPAGGDDLETLQRHNAQLEATVAELREHLDALASDHEERAAILAQEGDPLTQFKSLLGVKLRECHAANLLLRAESMSEVVRQSYRDVIEEVFAVLIAEGVPLKG